MKITPLASGSKGNAYIIDDGAAPPILIEAGISINALKERIWKAGYNITDISSCFISHAHKDHSRAAADLIRQYSIPCFMAYKTAEDLGLWDDAPHMHFFIFCIFQWDMPIWSPRISLKVPPMRPINYTIVPFQLQHDIVNAGFLFNSHATGKTILYATDTAYIRHRFGEEITHIMIECNYDPDALKEAMEAGELDMTQYLRIMDTHFGLDNVLEFLKANNLPNLQEVWLLHLSERHIDPKKAKARVQEAAGAPVYVANEEERTEKERTEC